MTPPMTKNVRTAAAAVAALIICAPATAAPATERIAMSGTARNVTVGDVAASTSMQLVTFDGAYGRLEGGFDNTALFGAFQAGAREHFACAAARRCFYATGSFTIGSDAGFEPETTTTFTVSLAIDPAARTAAGVYHIGPLPGMDFEQYGTLELTLTE